MGACHAALVAACLLPLTACDDAHVNMPKPPGGNGCASLDDYIHTIAIARATGSTVDATTSGSFAFLANGTDGAFVVDFSDPSDVFVASALDTLHDARAVDAEGSLLFVANGDGGLAVVDVSNPAAAHVVGVASMPGCAVDVDVLGTHAFVANDDLGLVIVDVSDPTAPFIAGIENTPGQAVGVCASVDEPLAFVADTQLGVRIDNVIDPAAPFMIRSIDVTGVAQAVACENGIVTVAAREGGLFTIGPVPASQTATAGNLPLPGDAYGVAMSNGIAFVADAIGGVRVVDVRDPAQPREINALGVVTYGRDVAVVGGRLVVADDQAGARVMEIASPEPPPLDPVPGITDARAVALLGSLVVVADAGGAIRVVDPATQTIVGSVSTPSGLLDVFVADSLAYVATTESYVIVADLHDPAAPVLEPSIPVGAGVDAAAVVEPFIYLLTNGGGVVERRLDGTGIPRDYTDFTAFFPSMTVEDPYIYLPNRQGDISVVLRASMSLGAIIGVGGSAERVVIRYEDGPYFPLPRVVVAISGLTNGQAAVETYDFTTLYAPQLLSRVECGGNAVDVAFDGTRMFVAEGADGGEVFDLLGAGKASPAGFLPGPVLRAAASGGFLTTAGGTSGLAVVPLGDCLR